MQSLPISSSSYENNIEDFTIKHLLLFKESAREICKKLVYKYSETMEYDKS